MARHKRGDELTREQLATAKKRAATLKRNQGDDEAADRYENMSIEEYADEHGYLIKNPAGRAQSKPKAAAQRTQPQAKEPMAQPPNEGAKRSCRKISMM